MSADPSSASSSEPDGPPLPIGGYDPATGSPRFPKRKRRHRRPEEEPVVEEDDEATLLGEILHKARERRRRSEIAEAARSSPVYRFLRRGEAAPGTSAPAPPPGGALPAFKPLVPAAAVFWDERRLQWLQIFLSYLVVAILVLAAYAFGRHAGLRARAGEGNAPDAARSSPWLPADYDRLLQARAADQAGDLDAALRLVDDLAKRVTLGPALRAYRATLNTRLGHVNEVDRDLCPLLNPDPPPDVSAAVNAARAFNFVRCRQYDLAADCFAAVARADPFDVPNLIHWGETLRRRGMLAAAAAKFQEALALLPSVGSVEAEAQREYAAYEWRLSQVEAGQGAGLEPEIARRLGGPAPSGYWLLTAAAEALQTGRLPEAVDALEKARAVFPPGRFDRLLRDDFFHAFASQPGLGAFLSTPSPEERRTQRLTMEYFVDE